MPDNSTPAAPPSGAPDGPPPPGASQPGRRGAAPCLSQYLDEHAEVIHQCAREGGHHGAHSSRELRTNAFGQPVNPQLRNRVWFDEHALGYVPLKRPLRFDPVTTPQPFRYLRMDLLIDDPRSMTRPMGL